MYFIFIYPELKNHLLIERKFVYNIHRTNVLLKGDVLIMYDYSLLPNRKICFIDLKAFYASVSCVKRGLDPRYTQSLL
ncbi:hypothetical protein bcgnr5396_49400 [Bacillus cereus]